MTYEEYQDYLKSATWQQARKKRLKIDNYRCQACGSYGNSLNELQIHHIGYRSLGNEDVLKSCVVLCKTCHRLVTNMMNRPIDESGERQKNWYYLSWHDSRELSRDLYYYQQNTITDD